MTAPGLTILLKPAEFFREKVATAIGSQKIKVSEEVEFYLVNLLCDFISPAKFQTEQGSLDLLDTPLALVLKTALESPPEDQLRLFKVLGDTSLYMSGYFQDFFNRKTFDVDYYIGVGSGAYTQVSALLRDQRKERNQYNLYEDLAQNFHLFVEVVAEVADHLESGHSSNILAMYDRWTRNQSTRLRRKLENSGISPIPGNMKIKQ